jgi:hypothetical protein
MTHVVVFGLHSRSHKPGGNSPYRGITFAVE